MHKTNVNVVYIERKADSCLCCIRTQNKQ